MEPARTPPSQHLRVLLACGAALAIAAGPANAQRRPPPPPAAPPRAAPNEAALLRQKLEALMGRPGGLTSDEVARRAESQSLDLAVKKADILQAASNVDQAYAAFFPRLLLLAKYTRLNHVDNKSLFSVPGLPEGSEPGLVGTLNAPCGTPANPAACNGFFGVPFSELTFPILDNQAILQASLTIPLSDYVLRSVQGLAAAAASRRAASLAAKATRYKVRTDARALYYNWVRVRLQQEVTAQALADFQGHLVDQRHLFDAGMASNADVLKVEGQVASVELLLERARNLTRVMADQVASAIGDPAAPAYEIGDDLRAPIASAPELGDDPAPLIDEAGRQRLEIKAIAESHATLVEQAKTVRAGYYPAISAFGDVGYINPNQRVIPVKDEFSVIWDVGVQATWSPNDVAISHATARGIEARAAQLDAQRQQLVLGVRAEVMQGWSSMREARTEVDTTARQLAASEESYRVRRELWKVGRATAIELTDAETDLTQARLAAVNASIDLRVAALRLAHAVGRDLSEK